MSRRPRASLSRRAIASVVLLVAVVGCTEVDVPESLPSSKTAAGDETPGAPSDEADEKAEEEEGNCLASLRPDGPAGRDVEPGSYMDEIQRRGELRVGVDVGTPRFSSVTDFSTGEPEGFDVDIAREVARALFGDPDRIELVGMTTGERVGALLEDGAAMDQRVDMVIHNFSITCSRWEQIAFSTEYFTAHQRILVPRDNPAESLEDLDGQRVCASRGSNVLDRINQMPEGDRPLPVRVPQRTDCLMLLQQGQVDALATDDTILAGMAAQDPNLRLGEEEFSVEHYGIGLPPGRPEWVRYVNAVLEDLRTSDRWHAFYRKWLDGIEGIEVDRDPPEPVYED